MLYSYPSSTEWHLNCKDGSYVTIDNRGRRRDWKRTCSDVTADARHGELSRPRATLPLMELYKASLSASKASALVFWCSFIGVVLRARDLVSTEADIVRR